MSWPIIGLSIVAANISTEQTVGMAGSAADGVGLAVSNGQRAGSVGVVLIAWTLLPAFLRAGISAIPEFLQSSCTPGERAVMAILTVVMYVVVLLTGVLFSGGVAVRTIFRIPVASQKPVLVRIESWDPFLPIAKCVPFRPLDRKPPMESAGF